MGTKMAVSFANIFMAKIEATLIQQSETKPKQWRRYIDDIFSLWDSHEKYVDQFIEQANKFHPTEHKPKVCLGRNLSCEFRRTKRTSAAKIPL